jgi:hypothetical protein
VAVVGPFGQGHRFVLAGIVRYDSFVQDAPGPAIRSVSRLANQG